MSLMCRSRVLLWREGTLARSMTSADAARTMRLRFGRSWTTGNRRSTKTSSPAANGAPSRMPGYLFEVGGKERLVAGAKTESRAWQLRSRTNRPCLRLTAVKIRGIRFCEPCAREQEGYFVIGELTDDSRRPSPGKESLAKILERMRRVRRGSYPTARSAPGANVPALSLGFVSRK